jgi:hypothetical protein
MFARLLCRILGHDWRSVTDGMTDEEKRRAVNGFLITGRLKLVRCGRCPVYEEFTQGSGRLVRHQGSASR